MAETIVASPQPETSAVAGPATRSDRTPSPPPNCAICLGTCINKCFSDSCMHQFCFKCLQEWSKVKPVCPLCKQPFKSIIHNVKSNDEYDQYYILQASSHETFEDMFLPRVISDDTSNTSRHFQFRTTLTLDPRGEVAIQQLLSTHLNTLPQYTSLNVLRNAPHYFRSRRIRDVSSSLYRRSLYDRNLWTSPLTDVTGRFREVSPRFFREGPATKNRLVPFLQRELNALIPDDSLRAMHLVHRILAAIDDHPIRGRFVRQMLQTELGSFTQHFVYEFYTYARSPYDLYGYDRHSQLMTQVPPEHESSDSDVLIVSVERGPTRLPPTSTEVIEIDSESSHDSDVIIREPTPPVLVDLANTTASSDDNVSASDGEVQQQVQVNQRAQEGESKMPAMMRHKRGRKPMPNKKRKRRSRVESSSASDHDTETSSSSSSSASTDSTPRPRKRLLLQIQKLKSSPDNSSDSSSVEDSGERREKRKIFRKKKSQRKSEVVVSSPTPTDHTSNTSIKYEQVPEEVQDFQTSSTTLSTENRIMPPVTFQPDEQLRFDHFDQHNRIMPLTIDPDGFLEINNDSDQHTQRNRILPDGERALNNNHSEQQNRVLPLTINSDEFLEMNNYSDRPTEQNRIQPILNQPDRHCLKFYERMDPFNYEHNEEQKLALIAGALDEPGPSGVGNSRLVYYPTFFSDSD